MSSPPRSQEREEERRLNIRTLAIASLASAIAAIVTSQFWAGGTPIAAAVTPVIVALVSEMLTRPTERIARSITTDRRAATPRVVSPPSPDLPSDAPIRVYRAGAAQPRAAGVRGGRGREADARGRSGDAGGDVRGRSGEPGRDAPGAAGRRRDFGARDRDPGPPGSILGSAGPPPGGRRPARRRKIAYGAVFATAALAFVIGIAALTLPELVAGGSVGKNDGRTTLFGGQKKNASNEKAPPETTTEEETQPEEEPEQQEAVPRQETAPPVEEEAPAEETAPQTTPAPGEPLPQTTTPVAPPAQP
jgi:hypothetical protein